MRIKERSLLLLLLLLLLKLPLLYHLMSASSTDIMTKKISQNRLSDVSALTSN